MTVNTATAETGSNGASVSTGDTGTPAWNAILSGTGSAFTYSNTGGCKSGTLCYAFSVGGTGATAGGEWTVNAGGSTSTQFHRLYIDPADMSGAPVIARGMDTLGNTQRWRLVYSAGTVVLRDSANNVVFTSSSLSSGTRYRVEWSVQGTTTGACQLQVFVGESTSTFYDSGASTGNFGGNIQKVRLGIGASQSSVSGKADEFGWSDTAALGPITTSATPAEAAWTLAAQDPTVSTASGGAAPTPAEAAWSIAAGAPTAAIAPGGGAVAVTFAAQDPTVTTAGAAGEAFLANAGLAALLAIEVAWGADLTADPATWVWTDVTPDVYFQTAVAITLGRADDTSQAQAASCSLTFDNSAGDYTPYNPNSANYPNVRRNLPLRVSVNLGSGATVVFQGYVSSLTPTWNTTASQALVVVTAGGALQRLGQSSAPLRPALNRAITSTSPAPLYYLPLEDNGYTGTVASGLTGGTSAHVVVDDYLGIVSAVPQWQNGDFGSVSLPDRVVSIDNGSHLLINHLSGVSSSAWSVDHVATFGTDNRGQNLDYIPTLYMGGTQFPKTEWDIELRPRGAGPSDLADLIVFVVQSDGSSSSTVLCDVGCNVFDGLPHHFRVSLAQSGGSVDWTLYVDGVATSGTVASTTLQPVTSLEFNPQFVATPGAWAVGKVCVWNTATPSLSASDFYQATTGYTGETPTDRITRLCDEESVPVTVTGTGLTPMGPQSVIAFVNLLRECEAVDGGVLFDGFDAGLRYTALSSRYNQSAAITIDASAGELAQLPGATFAPVDDDQRNRNDVTVSRDLGAVARVTEPDGPLGTATIGIYDTSLTVNTETDDPLVSMAAWQVHLGTVEGLRYPTLPWDFAAVPSKADDWLAAGDLGFRVDVTNIDAKATQHPPDDVSLIIEGYQATLSPVQWQVTANCSPNQPYVVGTVGAVATFHPWRLDGDASTLSASITSGATSLSVATSGTPLWVTNASFPVDFVFDIDVGGERMTVTSLTGASSPQTFTVTRSVNGVVKAHASGTTVSLWKPAVIAL